MLESTPTQNIIEPLATDRLKIHLTVGKTHLKHLSGPLQYLVDGPFLEWIPTSTMNVLNREPILIVLCGAVMTLPLFRKIRGYSSIAKDNPTIVLGRDRARLYPWTTMLTNVDKAFTHMIIHMCQYHFQDAARN